MGSPRNPLFPFTHRVTSFVFLLPHLRRQVGRDVLGPPHKFLLLLRDRYDHFPRPFSLLFSFLTFHTRR